MLLLIIIFLSSCTASSQAFSIKVISFKNSPCDPMSQRFGHPRVLGIPISKSLAFQASLPHITAAFWVSPGTLPGCPNPQCFGHPLKKKFGFRGKIENVLEMDSARDKKLFQYLKRRFIRKALQNKTKRLCENLPQNSSMHQNQSPCCTWPRRRMAQRFDDLFSPRKRKRMSSKSATAPFSGHAGRDNTLRKIKERFYWPDYYKDTMEMASLLIMVFKMPALIIENIRQISSVFSVL